MCVHTDALDMDAVPVACCTKSCLAWQILRVIMCSRDVTDCTHLQVLLRLSDDLMANTLGAEHQQCVISLLALASTGIDDRCAAAVVHLLAGSRSSFGAEHIKRKSLNMTAIITKKILEYCSPVVGPLMLSGPRQPA